MNRIERRYYFIRSDREYAALCRDLRAAGALTVECLHRDKRAAAVLLRIELPAGMGEGQFLLRLWDSPWCGGNP